MFKEWQQVLASEEPSDQALQCAVSALSVQPAYTHMTPGEVYRKMCTHAERIRRERGTSTRTQTGF